MTYQAKLLTAVKFPDLLLYVRYFASQNKEITIGDWFLCLLRK